MTGRAGQPHDPGFSGWAVPDVVGSVIGILLLAVGFNCLSLLGVPFSLQPVFNGGVLLVAVLVARAEARKVRVGT
ncbi:MAG: hypothetical protein QOE61_5718 [Micromonosporaceae bacterium]|jgi:ribose transport system permease protein|nr:hypothetical protein [Micromonosporaceae bacterium]